MLPPPTIPSRSVNSSDAGSAGPTPASSSSSSTLPTMSSIGPDGNSFTPATSTAWTERTLVQSGVFAGRHMRFHLDVAQQPIHGRRKTEKDRRPLAHCPILRLRFKECRQVGNNNSLRSSMDSDGWEEEEVDIATVETCNFICAADLLSPQDTPSASPFIGGTDPTSQSRDSVRQDDKDRPDGSRTTPAGSDEPTPRASPDMTYHRRPAPMSTNSSRSVDGDVTMGDRTERSYLKGDSDVRPSSWRAQNIRPPEHSHSSPNVLRTAHDASARLPDGVGELHETQQNKEERRERMFGRNLYGNSHVSGIRVPAPEGGVGLWFLFTDVTVRHEGEYTLRFRCFDITSVPSESAVPSPPLVSALSQTFKVYSPRNFPGIPRPTELAEHFNRLGFKLNTRKNERIAENLPAPASSTSADTPTRRPSPHPVQHHERRQPTSSLARFSSNNPDNSTGTAGSSGSSTAGTGTHTGTGSLTDPSSTGGSALLTGSAGSSGVIVGGPAGAVVGAVADAVGAVVGSVTGTGSSGGVARIHDRVDEHGRIDGPGRRG